MTPGGFFTTEPPGKAPNFLKSFNIWWELRSKVVKLRDLVKENFKNWELRIKKIFFFHHNYLFSLSL